MADKKKTKEYVTRGFMADFGTADGERPAKRAGSLGKAPWVGSGR